MDLSDLDSHLIHGSLGSHESPPNGISIGSAVFAQLTQHIDTQTTLHATSVAIDRIFALCGGEAA